MAYIIATGTAPQTAKLRGLQINLVNSVNYVGEINRQLDEMSDAEAAAQYGLDVGEIPAFRTQIDNLLATLQSNSVTNIISSLGFAK